MGAGSGATKKKTPILAFVLLNGDRAPSRRRPPTVSAIRMRPGAADECGTGALPTGGRSAFLAGLATGGLEPYGPRDTTRASDRHCALPIVLRVQSRHPADAGGEVPRRCAA